MYKLTTMLGAVACAAAFLTTAAPANAVTLMVQPGGGPFSAGDVGTIQGITANKLVTYDWTFKTTASLDVLMQMQATRRNGGAAPISFDLYSGSPGSGVLITSSPNVIGSSLESVLAAGDYFLELTPGNIAFNKELVSGSVTFFKAGGGVPEPATWAMMITGFGLLGLASRRRREGKALTAA